MSIASKKVKAAQLCRKLDISATKLRELIKAGLPCIGSGTKRRFDIDAVDAWLLENGMAEVAELAPGETIATTRAEAARLLGLNAIDGERIISRWAKQPGFPGKSGTPGKQDGYYPIEKIAEWRKSSGGRSGSIGDEDLVVAKRRLALLEIEEQELAAKERLGQLLDYRDVSTFFESQVVNAKAVFSQAPDRVLSRLPAEIPDAVRSEVYRDIQQLVEDLFTEMAQLLEGDTDPTNDEEDES